MEQNTVSQLSLPSPSPQWGQSGEGKRRYFSMEQNSCSFEECILFPSDHWCECGEVSILLQQLAMEKNAVCPLSLGSTIQRGV